MAGSPSSRRAWLAGVGVAAAAAGVYWYGRGAAPGDAATDGDAIDLWSQRFERPEGGELVMATLRGKPLFINFWATWCPPCIKELPEIDRFARDHAAKVQVVGLAIDKLEPVQAFLKKLPLGFAIGLAGLAGTELSRSLGNHAGALPFSVLLGADGKVAQRKLGETHYDELAGWAQKL
ncbi:MAG: TlpA family protein disulfide reductase [Rubrivivax sp.]|nr:TlpA family protein disulfide reductase [Rubrivivax sp.]